MLMYVVDQSKHVRGGVKLGELALLQLLYINIVMKYCQTVSTKVLVSKHII